MNNEGPSQLEIIKQFGCEKAFFTTYTLNLPWFVENVLPCLKDTGCKQITIFVDILGYSQALAAMKAAPALRSEAKDFALVPVSLNRNGIFHPKLTYLQGWEQTDWLLVGSGNLTRSGHGGKLEVLEVLRSDRDGRTFREFASFIDELWAIPERVWPGDILLLPELASRAQIAGESGAQKGPKLIHNLKESVYDQLLERARQDGRDWDELLVLSPFHSDDGEPVLRLAKALEVRKLKVGVDGHKSAFSFKKANQEGVCAVPISQPGILRRSLHAKWIELRSADGLGSIVLTGSINATRKSLQTTDNVELGVLRELKGPALTGWKEQDPDKVTLESNKESGDEVSEKESGPVVVARFQSSGCLKGSLVMPAGKDTSMLLQGEWEIRLTSSDSRSGIEGSVQVDAEGQFKWRHENLGNVCDNAGEISMSRDGFPKVCGWFDRMPEWMLIAEFSQRLAGKAPEELWRHAPDKLETLQKKILGVMDELRDEPSPPRAFP